MNKKISIIAIVLIVLALVYWLSAAKLTQNETNGTSSQTTTSIKVTPNGPLGVASSPTDTYLVGSDNLTLYTNVQDAKQPGTNIKSSCDAECEKTWIPYFRKATDAPMAKTADPLLSKLNAISRTDGKLQYALGNQPLYTYIGDTKLGDLNGASITNWMVAKP